MRAPQKFNPLFPLYTGAFRYFPRFAWMRPLSPTGLHFKRPTRAKETQSFP